jgi:ABC-type lipoprotein release transport system permease subunit
MLLNVSPTDPASFAATAAIEIAFALAACALPARRATQADPMLALRDDN